MQAMVEAVPMVLQVPAERDMPASAAMNSWIEILPALTCSESCQTTVPEPMSLPSCLPLSIGPPETTMVGMSQLAAPISSAGVVLSQPTSSTTRVHRVAADRFLDVHARQVAGEHRGGPQVGLAVGEHRELHRDSRRLRSTPRLTCSASLRKCALQGVSSDQVLQMPMIGLPWNS